MSVKENEALVHRYMKGYTTGKAENAEEFIAPQAAISIPMLNENGKYGFVPFSTGPQEYQAMVQGYHNAFPDVSSTIEDIIVTDNKAVVSFTLRGTFKGEFQGMAPNGNRFEYSVTEWIEFADGKISNVNSLYDQMGWFQQLGLLPT